MAAESSSRTAARQSRTKTSCQSLPCAETTETQKGDPGRGPFFVLPCPQSRERVQPGGGKICPCPPAPRCPFHGCSWPLFLAPHTLSCRLPPAAFWQAPCSSDLRHTARSSSMLLHSARPAAPPQGAPRKAVLCQKPGRALPYREPGGARPRRVSGKVLPCMSPEKAAASP